MKIRILGFSIDPTEKPSLDDLMSHIEATPIDNNKENENRGGRLVFVNTNAYDDYHVGLVITAKDAKTYCQLKKDPNGAMKLVVSDLDPNASLMEFNFFVIKKDSGIGLYQHYHQSCSMNLTMKLLQKQFNYVVKQKVEEAKKNYIETEDLSEKKATTKANKEHQDRFKWQMLVSEEKLNIILEHMQRIKALELNFSTLEVEADEFRGLKDHVVKNTQRFLFSQESKFRDLLKNVINCVNDSEADSGRVIAIDINDNEQTFDIDKNLDIFGVYEFDDVTKKIDSLDIDDFANSWMIKELINICKERSEYFKAKIRKKQRSR
ncbi:hypothetical protein NQS96_06455 [Pseudoalteromonas shioyasakiensis]|uniref:hypothetical protein n=1 Tax=Pseudoalteromonas shioyasakiensis TaxID=1190813 RepID=UPI0021185E5C|nr:hypothetical protein [Pseudoalteromonas shioyasakiensis]MCQ8881446.1 hypothetical protein [Pseudoalteromonas shioyasakiensis]